MSQFSTNFQNCTSLSSEYLLITNCTRRSCDFLFIIYSTKSRSTNQNKVTVSFISPLFVFTSETSETLWSNIGHLRKTSVEPRTLPKFFGSFGNLRNTSNHLRKSSEVFWSTSQNFGRLRTTLGNLRKSFGQPFKSSEDFELPSDIFGSFQVNFVNIRKTSEIFGSLQFNFGNLRMSWEDFAFISENFVSSCLDSTFGIKRYSIYRVRFGINCTALVQSECSNLLSVL